MKHINLDKLRAARIETDPFPYVIVEGFVSPQSIARVNATFPTIAGGGSYPTELLSPEMAVSEVIEELNGPEFEQLVSEKFDVDLSGYPKMFSLRGNARTKDGSIHTDSKDKIITVLVYLNEHWQEPGGRLRLLRNGEDLENFVAEVPPDNGTLLIFKRSENSWHGHHPFQGQRRSLQMNWMVDDGRQRSHVLRHKLSNVLKRAVGSLAR